MDHVKILQSLNTYCSSFTQDLENQAKEMVELKNQLGQIAEFMRQIQEQSELPISTIVNLMGDFEIVKAITLKSGMEVVGDLNVSNHSLEVDKEELLEKEEEDLDMASLEKALLQHQIILNPSFCNPRKKRVRKTSSKPFLRCKLISQFLIQ
ncbi:unnamed protein product [Malus baccata var. baccata]